MNNRSKVSWYKDGSLLRPSAILQIRTLGDCRKLLLRRAKCDDGGDYKVSTNT